MTSCQFSGPLRADPNPPVSLLPELRGRQIGCYEYTNNTNRKMWKDRGPGVKILWLWAIGTAGSIPFLLFLHHFLSLPFSPKLQFLLFCSSSNKRSEDQTAGYGGVYERSATNAWAYWFTCNKRQWWSSIIEFRGFHSGGQRVNNSLVCYVFDELSEWWF